MQQFLPSLREAVDSKFRTNVPVQNDTSMITILSCKTTLGFTITSGDEFNIPVHHQESIKNDEDDVLDPWFQMYFKIKDLTFMMIVNHGKYYKNDGKFGGVWKVTGSEFNYVAKIKSSGDQETTVCQRGNIPELEHIYSLASFSKEENDSIYARRNRSLENIVKYLILRIVNVLEDVDSD